MATRNEPISRKEKHNQPDSEADLIRCSLKTTTLIWSFAATSKVDLGRRRAIKRSSLMKHSTRSALCRPPLLFGRLCFHGFAPHQKRKLSLYRIQPMKPAAATPNTTQSNKTSHAGRTAQHNTRTMLTSLLDGCLMCSASSLSSPSISASATSCLPIFTTHTSNCEDCYRLRNHAAGIPNPLALSDKCTVLSSPDKRYTIFGETLYREARLSIFHLIIPSIARISCLSLPVSSKTPLRVNCFAN